MTDIIKHLDLNSTDGAQLNMDALYQIAPSAFTEVRNEKTGEVTRKVNFEVLRQLLGDKAVDGDGEMYQFTWVGKNAARAEAAAPTTKTLRPVVEDSVDWDNTKNIYIEGDNLEVLKLLQRSYMGKVKMIYIDPPYNTGNDFVYHDDFARTAAEEDLEAGNVDELGNRFRKNTDTNGKFHSDWCSMIYSRLLVARSLLVEDGVIFISIDDNEVENLKKICNEVFGENNFIADIIWKHTQQSKNDELHFSRQYNHTLCYAKCKSELENFYFERTEEDNVNYKNPDNDPKGLWRSGDVRSPNYRKTLCFDIVAPNGNVIKSPDNGWRWSKESVEEKIKTGEIKFKDDYSGIIRKIYLCDQKGRTPENLWEGQRFGTTRQAAATIKELFGGKQVFDTPKPQELIMRMLEISSAKESLVLDFFSGSATTAHAVMQLNSEDNGHRKYIMVQLPEETPEDSEARKSGYKTIPEIAKERIRRAGKKIKADSPLTTQNLDTGFRVYRLDDSNYENVSLSPKEYKQDQLDLFANNIKADRTDLDLLYGAMLAWGVQLDLPLQTEVVDGCTVYTVNEGDLVACFAEGITDKVVATMAEKSPLRVLFRDACFKEDAQKINIYEQFKQALDWADDEAFKNIRVI